MGVSLDPTRQRCRSGWRGQGRAEGGVGGRRGAWKARFGRRRTVTNRVARKPNAREVAVTGAGPACDARSNVCGHCGTGHRRAASYRWALLKPSPLGKLIGQPVRRTCDPRSDVNYGRSNRYSSAMPACEIQLGVAVLACAVRPCRSLGNSPLASYPMTCMVRKMRFPTAFVGSCRAMVLTAVCFEEP